MPGMIDEEVLFVGKLKWFNAGKITRDKKREYGQSKWFFILENLLEKLLSL